MIPGWSASNDVVTLNFSITEWNISQIDSENNVYQLVSMNVRDCTVPEEYGLELPKPTPTILPV